MQAGRSISRCAGLAALVVLLWAAPNASAAIPNFLTQSPEDGKGGTAAGQMGLPRGIAADPNLPGHVYVADDLNERIDEFTPWGEFVRAWGWGVDDGSNEFQVCTEETGCQKGIKGSGVGQFARPEAIATDAAGDVYVMEGENHRVQKFDSEGNFLLMVGGEVNETTKANVCSKADIEGGNVCKAGKAGAGAGEFQFGFLFYINGITTSPVTGTVFVAGNEKRIQAFNPNGSFKEEIKGGCLEVGNIETLTSDSTGNLYVAFEDGTEVRKLSPTGPTATCAAEPKFVVERVFALAVSPEGHLYANVEGGAIEPPRILEFDASGKCLNCNEEGEGGKPGFDRSPGESLRAMTVGSGCGVPDLYVTHFRPTAPSLAFFRIWGEPPNVALCPPPIRAPEITSQFTLGAEATQATLQAEINPKFWPDTRYYVEYGTGICSAGGCPNQKPIAPGSILTTKTTKSKVKTAVVTLEGLTPATAYHYRFVSESSGGGPVFGTGSEPGSGTLPEATAEEGGEGGFRTFAKSQIPSCPINAVFRTGPSALLPDCRAYELVSPLEKGSGDIIALPEFTTALPSTLDQSSVEGDKLAYGTYRSFGDAPSAPFTSQYVAKRSSEGWQSHAISPPRGRGTVDAGHQIDTELKLLSPDLCKSWWRTVAEAQPPLDPAGVPEYPNLYLREDDECVGVTTWEALSTVQPPNLPSPKYTDLEQQGQTPDGSTTIYVAADSLAGSGAPPQPPSCDGEALAPVCLLKLYYRAAGEAIPHYVCVLPDGTALAGSCSAGMSFRNGGLYRLGNMQGALSADGSRVFWTAAGDGTAPIFIRENPGAAETPNKDGEGNCEPDPELACTIAVSKEAEELTAGKSLFWAAAADGSRAIFTTGGNAATGVGGTLYSFEVATATTTPIAAKVLGVAGVSEDAQRVYLVSEEDCGGAGVAGQRNLYLWEAGDECAAGDMAFVVTLVVADVTPEPSRETYSSTALAPSLRWTRVTPDGQGLAFGSFGQPTGYDNTDQRTGEADAEVYLYDAVSEELHCASCNPSGARPLGVDTTMADSSQEFWVAGMIGGWENNLYAGRDLSDDGNRLFFESSDALTPRDTNGMIDVYQWEALGTGGCKETSSSFSPSNGGCVDLLSSGQGAQNARFHDASPSGDDVFFSTLESLLGQDFGLIDIYDARVEGGFPAPPPPPIGCEGENCQNPAPPPPYNAPASSLYDGPGNLSEKPPKKACPKGKVKKGGKCVKKKKGKGKKRHAHKRGAKR